MKVTFDSNLWERVVHPHTFPLPPETHAQLLTVHEALKAGRVTGFITESVPTLEGVKRKDRPKFMTGQTMRPRVLDTDPEFKPVIFAPDQSARPDLMPVLIDRMKDAAKLGMRLIKVPAYHEMNLPHEFYAEWPEGFIEKYGRVEHAIKQRKVGRAIMVALGHELAAREGGTYVYSVGALPPVQNLTEDDNRRIAKAVAEAADGDAVAAHIAFGNDYFASHDFGHSAATSSVLDRQNREWLSSEYKVKFVTLPELATLIVRDDGGRASKV
jgi:hypothetical protein